MVDPALIARAVKAGLVLARCPVCDGCGRLEQSGVNIGMLGGSYGGLLVKTWSCPLCEGYCEDRTPWSLFGAVATHWTRTGLDHFVAVALDTVCVWGYDARGGNALSAMAREPHTGTPESIATAALEAFCRAMGASDGHP